MPRTAKARIFRSTMTAPNSGTVKDLATTFGTAANATTTAAWGATDVATWKQWVPNTTSVTAEPPAVGTTATGRGWRDSVAENANEIVRYLAGTWTIRVRLTKTGQTLPADITVRVVLIVYQVTSAGAYIAELGRIQMADTNLSTATLTLTGSFTTGTDTDFAAGDKIQVEGYVTGIVAGLPTSPTGAVNFNFLVDETSANSGASFTAQPGYDIRFARSQTMIGIGVHNFSRTATLKREFELVAVGLLSLVRLIGKPLSVVGIGSFTFTRKIQKPLVFTAIGNIPIIKFIRKSISFVGISAASVTRLATLFRSVNPSSIGAALVSRALIIRKLLEPIGIGLASVTKVLSLRRIVEGAGFGAVTLIRKVQLRLAFITHGLASAVPRSTLSRLLSAAAVGESALSRALFIRRTVSAVGIGLMSLVRRMGIILRFVSIGASDLLRRLTLFRMVAPVSIGLVTVAKRVTKTLSFIGVGVTSLTRALTLRRVLSFEAIAAAALVRRIGKSVTTVAIGASAITRNYFKSITFVAHGLSSMAQRYFKVVNYVAIGSAFVGRALTIRRAVEAVGRGAVKIFAKIPIERIPGGSGVTNIIKKIFPIFDD